MKNLSIAYEMKKRNKKNGNKKSLDSSDMFAEGGSVKEQSRPMPESKNNDSKMVKQNDHIKSNPAPAIDPRPIKDASKMSLAPVKHPKLMGNPKFKVVDAMEAREEQLMQMKPDGGGKQPPEYYNEEDADKQGPVPAAQKKFAQGGEVSIQKEMYDQPMEEAELEHHASIAAAIMSKMKRNAQDSGSKDDDKAVMMAEGGRVDIEENMTEEPNMYYKLNKQALKEPMMGDRIDEIDQPEDSNLINDPREEAEENEHDMISKLRSKIMKKRFFGE